MTWSFRSIDFSYVLRSSFRLLISPSSLVFSEACLLKKIHILHVQTTKFETWADPEGGDRGTDPPFLKNQKNIEFLSNTGPDPLKNYKATKPAFNVGPSSIRQ